MDSVIIFGLVRSRFAKKSILFSKKFIQPMHAHPGAWGCFYMYFLSISSIRAFGTAPTIWSTCFPFLKINNVGIAIMSNLPDVAGFSSVFNFPNATFPLYSFAKPSITGPTIRQGPHQGAQQSTRIRGYFDKKESKLLSSTFTGESIEVIIKPLSI